MQTIPQKIMWVGCMHISHQLAVQELRVCEKNTQVSRYNANLRVNKHWGMYFHVCRAANRVDIYSIP